MVLREKALRGDARALDRLLELALRFNNDAAEIGPAQALSADDQAILAAYEGELAAAMAPAIAGAPDGSAPIPAATASKKAAK